MTSVFGLDLSLTGTGIAEPNGATSVLRPKTKGVERLMEIRDDLYFAIVDASRRANDRDVLVMIEHYAYGRTHQAHQLGELGGVIRLMLHDEGIDFIDVAPTALKKYATGKGNASKDEVLAAAIRRLGYEGHDNNEADALWLQEIGLDGFDGQPPRVPETHRDVLAKLDWPEDC